MKRLGRLWGYILFLAIAAFVLIYKWPSDIEKLSRDISQSEYISVSATVHGEKSRDMTEYKYELRQGDAGYDEIKSAFLSERFSRSIMTLFYGSRTRTHPISPGDLEWEIAFMSENEPPVRIHNFYGDMTLDFGFEKTLYITPLGGDAWGLSIMDIIKSL